MVRQLIITIALILIFGSSSVIADENNVQTQALKIAVASDFVPVAEKLGKEYTGQTGIPVEITSGSSEELLQKIKKGEQFDVYMSANTDYPLDLEKTGYTSGSPEIYAIGILALYAKGKELTHSGLDLLQPGGFSKLAIGNPKQSPYGVASVETLKKLGIYDQVQTQLVSADNIAKALEMVESGQVEAGLVAYPDLSDEQKTKAWIVPSRMHDPIRQAQVALKGGNIEAAEKWIKFLETDTSKNVLMYSGYGITNVEEVSE